MRTRVGVVALMTVLISSGGLTLGSAQAEELVFDETKLTAGDGGPESWFGRSLAISGDTAVIGALSNDLESVYVFARGVDGEWAEEAKLTASDPGPFSSFGLSLAVSGDTVVVGDYQDDDLGNSSGSAYVFTRSGGIWIEEAKLTASDGTADMFFGFSVGVSGDTAIVGAYGDEPFGDNSGSAYIFTRSAGVWTEQAKLTNSAGAPNDFLGWWVGLSGDTGVVCAYGLNSAHVFSGSGSVWVQEAELTASDAGSEFCRSAALSGDTLVVGDTYNQDVGAAYVFSRSGSEWTQEAKLTASDGTELQEFGWSVGVSGDTLVVGAPDSWTEATGSAYVFQRAGSNWTEEGKVVASDGEIYDTLGSSVGVSGDTLIVGSPGDDDLGLNSGSAYLLEPVSGFSVSVSGSCPGEITLTVTTPDPDRDLLLFAGPSEGTSYVPWGPCGGTELDIAFGRRWRMLTTDENGVASIARTVASNFCGRVLQALDRSCATSNVARFP